jgi:hypothetical protein
MGNLTYGNTNTTFSLDDRTLAHLEIVIGEKFGHSESFFMAWSKDLDHDRGRSVIWMDHTIPVHLDYFSAEEPDINDEWIDQLTSSANSAAGLVVTPEPSRGGLTVVRA